MQNTSKVSQILLPTAYLGGTVLTFPPIYTLFGLTFVGRGSGSGRKLWTSLSGSWRRACRNVNCGFASKLTYEADFRSWCLFRGLIGRDRVFGAEASVEEISWDLIDFASWCFASQGNAASTITGKPLAVQLALIHI